MNSARLVSGALLLLGVASGTLSDRPRPHPPIDLGGYHVLAADFHVHTFPFSGSTLAPWDLVLDARWQGLDAIAITGHNQVLSGIAARWFSRRIHGPIVLVGEEIHAPGYHVVAAGIHSTISWRLKAADAIAEIHRQGGIAIAAHPVAAHWPAYDARALASLDASEVLQPIAYIRPSARLELRQFYSRARLAPIGSSDYHGPGPLGLCRTLVFAREDTEPGILEALRQHRTLVFDQGLFYGDPALVALAARDGRLAADAAPPSSGGFLPFLSRISGILGLLGCLAFGFSAPPHPSEPS